MIWSLVLWYGMMGGCGAPYHLLGECIGEEEQVWCPPLLPLPALHPLPPLPPLHRGGWSRHTGTLPAHPG